MKHVILTDYEASQINTSLELTSGRISEELKLWESMEGKTPNAKRIFLSEKRWHKQSKS